jgi:hypothetical protein
MSAGRSWLPPAEWWPVVQESHSARDTGVSAMARTMLYEHRKVGRSGGDNGCTGKAALKQGTKAWDSSYEACGNLPRSTQRLSDWGSWSKQPGCPAGRGKWGTGPCGGVGPSGARKQELDVVEGGVGPLRNGKRDSARSRSRKCASTGHLE